MSSYFLLKLLSLRYYKILFGFKVYYHTARYFSLEKNQSIASLKCVMVKLVDRHLILGNKYLYMMPFIQEDQYRKAIHEGHIAIGEYDYDFDVFITKTKKTKNLALSLVSSLVFVINFFPITIIEALKPKNNSIFETLSHFKLKVSREIS